MERLYNYLKRNLNITKSELDEVIKDVLVNGMKVSLTKLISEDDLVTYKGQELTNFNEKHLYLYHKRVGVEVTNNLANPNSYLHFIPKFNYRLFSLGRLDKDSRGLLVLTNDSQFYELMGDYEKEYEVEVNKAILDNDLLSLTKGIKINDYITKECKVERITTNKFRIILKEGKNRQIRRMCQALGYQVIDLKRVRLANFLLDGLKEDEICELDYTLEAKRLQNKL